MINPVFHLSALGEHHRRPSQGAGAAKRDDAVYDSRFLEDRLDRLALICMAMWSLLQSKTDLTEEDLLQRVKEIDLMDGTEDGKITRQVVRRSKCDRPMSSRHTRCIYCGSEQLAACAFDTV